MKVLIVSIKDQAGSGYRFVEALRAGGVEASIAVMEKHKNGYAYDHFISGGKRTRAAVVDKLLDGVDVIHYKGDHLPGTCGLKIYNRGVGIPRAFTAGGSGFRRRGSTDIPKTCLHWYPVSMYRQRVDVMSAITPDLMYTDDIRLVPHAYPVMPFSRPGNSIPVIGHSPSVREKKGTNNVFLPAIDILRSRGHRFEVDLIEGVSNAECIERKYRCDLFFDQAECDAYGMSAVEAMMRGVPVVTRMSMETRMKDPGYAHCPLKFFSERSPVAAADAMEATLMAGSWIAEATYQWAISMHSYESVHHRLMDMYKDAKAAHGGQKRLD